VHFTSPFALHAHAGWVDAAELVEIPEGGVTERMIKNRSVLLSKRSGSVSCFDNQCAHLGMPLEMGVVQDGVITCSYHGFQYLLETGECLTAPEVQLKVHAVRVTGNRVQVRLEE
jgi:nitrite reductase/ring-hydroxylating ferredoxin subunit